MEYTDDTKRTAKNYNLEERAVLLCTLIAAGADRGEAYYSIYDHGTRKQCKTIEQARTRANEFLNLNPGAAVLIQRLKERKQINSTEAKKDLKANNITAEADELTEEEVKKFTDKSYIIRNLSILSKSLTGKDRATVLMQIADLQRMKNEETKTDEERRRFYLPFVSHCRSCKLVQLLREATAEAPGK